MDLNKMVMKSLTKMETEGKVQEIVDNHVAKTIGSIVGDLFGNWSEFSKNLKKQVEEELQVNLKELDLASYNTFIMKAVKEKLDDSIASEGVKRINETIDALLDSAKSEYSLSELVKEMAKEVDTDDFGYDDYHEMTMIIDDTFSLSKIIYLDSENDKEKYDCKYTFWVNKETAKISNIQIKENRSHSRDVNEFDARAIMRGFRGLEEILFKMYARGSKLVVDEENVELEITNAEY
ncbi:hypothetical protein R0K30_02395 [Bacillus sp. SIMBA_154]|uniref:hypothetical protein n=1 Tax=Bacillus sp. SIMBA_154 TaxID=3080859 RepID=UPI00397D1EB5